MNSPSKKKIVVVTLLVYTYLNIRALYPFLFSSDHASYLLGLGLQNGGMGLFAVVIALFLNAAMILHFLKD
ncbi:MAG: hypothetical protein PHD04_03235 [Candidatus Pacebacteria bacterium]|nr:hypothetical protein [Candidatus Paceibacterota bacterium]